MDHFLHLNIIRLFDFYLATMFVIGLYRRRGIYSDAARLMFSTLSQRLRLLGVVSEHRREILTRNVIRPVFVAIGLMTIQWIFSRLLFPQARLTIHELSEIWWKLLMAIAAFLPMLTVDIYFLVRIGRFDHGETTKYLDQAERWLSWQGPLVRIATFGMVDPKQLVKVEVQKSLRELGAVVSWSLWWTSVQVLLRVIFGVTIWLLWAFG